MGHITEIVIGTTPTIKYTFNKVNVNDITKAILSISRYDNVILTKSLSEATVGNDFLSWTLTQEETLNVGESTVNIMLNWVDTSGIRGVGESMLIKFTKNDINEVL